jgi:hypothetical protein
MRNHPGPYYPMRGDVLYLPRLGVHTVMVAEVTRWRVTLVRFGDPDRPVIARWWVLWFLFRCRHASFVCAAASWSSSTR